MGPKGSFQRTDCILQNPFHSPLRTAWMTAYLSLDFCSCLFISSCTLLSTLSFRACELALKSSTKAVSWATMGSLDSRSFCLSLLRCDSNWCVSANRQAFLSVYCPCSSTTWIFLFHRRRFQLVRVFWASAEKAFVIKCICQPYS